MAVLSLALCAPQSQAWTSPQTFYAGAARDVFLIAGDPAGNAFAVLAGETADRPLLMIERHATGPDAFVWKGAHPFPGGDRHFTTRARGLDGFEVSAAGDGAGLIAWRDMPAPGGPRIRAVVRDSPLGFGEPVTIADGDFAPTSEVSAAVNASGSAIVAFRRGSGRTAGRTGFAWRRPAGVFSSPRTLSPSATSSHAAVIGDDGASVVGWIRGTKVEALRVGGDGKPTKVQRLGSARASGGLGASLSTGGAGVLAWQDGDGAIRVVRRSVPGRFSVSLPVRTGSNKSRIDGLSCAVDDRGRAFVAWREQIGADRRIYATTAAAGGEFKIRRIADGKEIGVPSLTARPGGGAVVTWRQPEGWQARLAPRNGVFAAAVAVSKPLGAADRTVARSPALAGPGERVDMFWPQTEPTPDIPGDVVYQSFEVQD